MSQPFPSTGTSQPRPCLREPICQSVLRTRGGEEEGGEDRTQFSDAGISTPEHFPTLHPSPKRGERVFGNKGKPLEERVGMEALFLNNVPAVVFYLPSHTSCFLRWLKLISEAKGPAVSVVQRCSGVASTAGARLLSLCVEVGGDPKAGWSGRVSRACG